MTIVTFEGKMGEGMTLVAVWQDYLESRKFKDNIPDSRKSLFFDKKSMNVAPDFLNTGRGTEKQNQ